MTPGVLPALASAGLYGVASALQHREVGAVPARGSLDPRLLRDLARRWPWWGGIAADVGAIGLQLLALHEAPVALVQALLVLGLPVAVVLTARGRLRPAAVAGTGLTAAGVVAFGLAQPAAEPEAGGARAVVAPLVVLALAALLARARRSAVLGLAAGLAAGAAAALLAVAVAGPWSDLLTRPTSYAAAVGGLLALQLTQTALADRDAGPALAGLTLAEPVTAVLLAAAGLDQHPDLAPVALVGLAAATAGVVLLERTRS